MCIIALYGYKYFYVESHDIYDMIGKIEPLKFDYEVLKRWKKELPQLKAQLDILQKEKDTLGDKFFECEQDSDCTSFVGSGCSCPQEVFVKRVSEYNSLIQLINDIKKSKLFWNGDTCQMFCLGIPSKCESGKCIAI
jgi:hypothetical protein